MHRFLSLLVLALLPLPVAAQDAWKKEAIAYLQSLQTSTGGFLSMAPRPEIRLAPTLRATSAGVRALNYLGGKVPNQDAAAKFVLSCYDEASGGFSDMPRGKPDVFVTAVGLMAVKELGVPLDKFKEAAGKSLGAAKGFDEVRIAVAGFEAIAVTPPLAKEWLELVEKDRNKDGSWGKDAGLARDTGSYAVAVLRLGAKLDKRVAVVEALRAGQRKDGGFGKADSDSSDLETTYRVMRCFMMLKESPRSVDALHGFIRTCQNKDGGFGPKPGEGSNISATYYAAIIERWLK